MAPPPLEAWGWGCEGGQSLWDAEEWIRLWEVLGWHPGPAPSALFPQEPVVLFLENPSLQRLFLISLAHPSPSVSGLLALSLFLSISLYLCLGLFLSPLSLVLFSLQNHFLGGRNHSSQSCQLGQAPALRARQVPPGGQPQGPYSEGFLLPDLHTCPFRCSARTCGPHSRHIQQEVAFTPQVLGNGQFPTQKVLSLGRPYF